MSDQTGLKRKKFRTAMFLLLTVVVLYIGVFFFKDL
jgi:hypothetical protein